MHRAVGCIGRFHAIVFRQLDGILRVHVPVFFRGVEWQVRLEKTYRQEKRLLLLGQAVERLNSMLGQATIRVGAVRHVGILVRGSTPGLGS